MWLRSRDELVRRLVKLGWLATQEAARSDLVAAAVRAMQRAFGGRESDSEAYTWELLDAARCGCIDRESLVTATGLCRWPDAPRPVRLWLHPQLPKLSAETWRSLTREACDRVEAVCGLTFDLVGDVRDAHVQIVGARIDGAGRVLADMELPCGVEATRATRMRIDVDEDWGVTAQQRFISALDVLVHEGGHRDGLPHIPADQATCVMNPIYNPALRATLQPRDVAEYVRRYGPRASSSPPGNPALPSNPTLPPADELVIRIRDSVPTIDGYLVSKRP